MDRENITSRSLRVFCQAARYGSFSTAARMMGVSPAYVTKHVQALEVELDAVLFHRSTHRVVLTEQGEEIYAVALQILQDIEQMHDKISQHKKEPRGLLKISTSLGFGRQVVAPALINFSIQYPKIFLQLEFLDHLVDLAQERYDLDVRIGNVIDPNHIARRLASNHRVLCAAPAYLTRRGTPTTLAELGAHDCLIIRERDHPVGIWALTDATSSENVKVSGPLVTNNGEAAVLWALAGRGIVLRSVWDVGKYLDAGALHIILPRYRQSADIWAVYPQRLQNSAKVKVCVEHLERYFEASSESPAVT